MAMKSVRSTSPLSSDVAVAVGSGDGVAGIDVGGTGEREMDGERDDENARRATNTPRLKASSSDVMRIAGDRDWRDQAESRKGWSDGVATAPCPADGVSASASGDGPRRLSTVASVTGNVCRRGCLGWESEALSIFTTTLPGQSLEWQASPERTWRNGRRESENGPARQLIWDSARGPP